MTVIEALASYETARVDAGLAIERIAEVAAWFHDAPYDGLYGSAVDYYSGALDLQVIILKGTLASVHTAEKMLANMKVPDASTS